MHSTLTPNQLRQKYLDFFVKHDHVIIPSAPLVPENDPTTLFTSSGMQPLVPYLLGQPHPSGKRLVDAQKSFRSQDIEEVGDNRHTTFFEMLGNWSLGDYFKAEQLRWFFTFLTDELGFDPAKLYATVFRGNQELGVPRDEESVAIWQTLFQEKGIEARAVDHTEEKGLQGGRIFYYGETKNWWSRSGVPANMPAGEPGGPDSEVFYDFGEERKLHEHSLFKDTPCHVNCDCGRFLEIGNSVFMQYQKQVDGSFQELPQKNVDFGGGFERIFAALNDQMDIFCTPIFAPLISALEEASGMKYNGVPAMRIIADHLRAATFLIVDGVLPSNKAQGYVLRRLLRRSSVQAHFLHIDGLKILPRFAQTVLQLYDGVHNIDVQKQKDVVESVIRDELTGFGRTLEKGLKILEKTPDITGKTAFDLYQSYGFPLELTLEIVSKRGEKVGRMQEGSEEQMGKNKDGLRQGSDTKQFPPIDKEQFKEEFAKHQERSRSASAGMFKGGLADQSETTTKYHTATHLLQAALRKVLGNHVQQKGSHITGERLRFDFTHPAVLTAAERRAVEELINSWIDANLPVTRVIVPKTEALASGAIGLFAEKYGDEVSVYTIGGEQGGQQAEGDKLPTDKDKQHIHDDEKNSVQKHPWISRELCGGPHVTSTGQIGHVELFKEEAVSAGVRRVYMKSV